MTATIDSQTPTLHVFLGTKAQLIKTAPLLRILQSRGLDFTLIDSGQHAAITHDLRDELEVRTPDVMLGPATNVDTYWAAAKWAAKQISLLRSRSVAREKVFGGRDGIVIVHGDTLSTLFSCLLARRAGLRVAHLESGLRSGKLTHPFPEEAIRIVVMKLASYLYAPSPEAVQNLEDLDVKGEIVPIDGNTTHEALAWSLKDNADTGGPVVATMHRVENLRSRQRVELFVQTLLRIAHDRPVRFVLHGPTMQTLSKGNALERLQAAGVAIDHLLPHEEFVEAISQAPFVITDGGSIQEEAGHIGVPTLLWRDRTERNDGIDRNVIISHYDDTVISDFLTNFATYRREPNFPENSPSSAVADHLTAALAHMTGHLPH